MSFSLGLINQNLLMISNFFLVFIIVDFFFLMVIDFLIKVMLKWYVWVKKVSLFLIFKDVNYFFFDVNLSFFGIIV